MVLVLNGSYDDTGHEDAGHPERPERATAVRAAIADLHLDNDLITVPSRVATRSELARVHEVGYLEELMAFCYAGGGDIDADTYATVDSWSAATNAAGGGLAVLEELQSRGDGVGFVVARPPGHHALPHQAMGFCLLNNIAVAAAALLDQGERVLIVDWDVHHGNGTQRIFWDDPRVLYVSTHQWPLFPGGGTPGEVGGRHAVNHTVNIPLPAGTTGAVLIEALETIAAPIVDQFKPTWVLVSAGFDAHRDDPMAEFQLTSSDFANLTRTVTSFTPKPGRLAMFLEGGYDLRALRSSVHATLSAALGIAFETERTSMGTSGADQVARIEQERRKAIDVLDALDAGESTS